MENAQLKQIEEELRDVQYYACSPDWDVSNIPITPSGIEVHNIPNGDSLFGFNPPMSCDYDRFGIECTIGGDPDNDNGVLVTLRDTVLLGRRIRQFPFGSVEQAKANLAQLVYDFLFVGKEEQATF